MESLITFEKISKWPESRKGLLYIILSSILLKLLLFVSYSTINNDGLLYISAAQEFAAGHFKEGLSIYPMPFYPILITMFHFLIPDWVAAARIISIAFMVFTLIPLHLLTKDLFDQKSAFWTCFAFALSPFLNGLADGVIRDPGFLFCIAWAVFFSLRSSQSTKTVFFVMAALFSWFSLLFRLEGIILILFFPIYLLALYFIEEQKRAYLLKRSLLFIIIPLFLAAIIFSYFGNVVGFLNRIGDILAEFKKFYNFNFLDNYYTVYKQLIELEKYSPYPGGAQNFAETARHYIPVIYIFGLIETFIVVLFPLYVVPLLFGFKSAIQKNHVFVLSLFFAYLIMNYYFLIKEDFTQSRFFLVPLFLIFPWIGAGMHKFFEYLSGKFSKKVFAALFILFFIIPIYECVEKEWKQDNSLMVAAKWIGDNTKDYKLKIITTDKRFLFYAGRKYRVGDASPGTDGDAFYSLDTKNTSYNGLEQVAIKNKFDLIMFKISTEAKEPQFKHFKRIKEFKGNKNKSLIYSSPEVADRIGTM